MSMRGLLVGLIRLDFVVRVFETLAYVFMLDIEF